MHCKVVITLRVMPARLLITRSVMTIDANTDPDRRLVRRFCRALGTPRSSVAGGIARLEAAPFAFERLKTQTEFGRGSRRLVA